MRTVYNRHHRRIVGILKGAELQTCEQIRAAVHAFVPDADDVEISAAINRECKRLADLQTHFQQMLRRMNSTTRSSEKTNSRPLPRIRRQRPKRLQPELIPPDLTDDHFSAAELAWLNRERESDRRRFNPETVGKPDRTRRRSIVRYHRRNRALTAADFER